MDSGHPEKPKPNREFLAEQLRKQSTQMLIVHPVDLELTHSIKVKKPLSLTSGTELKLTHSVRGQHTITIHSDVLMEEDGTSVLAIHAGSVNAFQFGKKEMEPRAVSAYAELLLQVEQEVVGRSESEAAGRSDGGVPTSSVLSMMDASGATMLHGLLIANTDAAIEVVFRIFEELPQALLQAHGSTRDSGPLFVGENHMHILVTNARNEQACRFMRLVVSKFSTSKLSELLRGQPSGTFFGDEPMINFGGHALAWAAGMGHLPILEEAVRLGLTDWVNWPCEESGFLPMHVAAQASAQETISWLLHQFGDGQLDVQAGTLTPLMLAGRAGRQEAVQSILEINRTSLWKWGSLEQCTMRIKPELDSHASEKQLTLLELLVRYDSIRKTNEMLLDTFMCGTLFTFYREKWRLQARAWFYVSMALLCLYLLALTALTSPYMRRVLSVEALGSITLGSALLMVEEEVREVLLWMIGLSPEEMATAKGLPSMRFPSAASTAIALFLERGGILKYLTLAAAVTLSLLVLTADVPAERLELQDVRCMLAAAATTGWLMLFTQVVLTLAAVHTRHPPCYPDPELNPNPGRPHACRRYTRHPPCCTDPKPNPWSSSRHRSSHRAKRTASSTSSSRRSSSTTSPSSWWCSPPSSSASARRCTRCTPPPSPGRIPTGAGKISSLRQRRCSCSPSQTPPGWTWATGLGRTTTPPRLAICTYLPSSSSPATSALWSCRPC